MAITVKDYVTQRGVLPVAHIASVTPATVYNWINKTAYPDPFTAALLIEDSMKLLSYDSIYGQYVEAHPHKLKTLKARQKE